MVCLDVIWGRMKRLSSMCRLVSLPAQICPFLSDSCAVMLQCPSVGLTPSCRAEQTAVTPSGRQRLLCGQSPSPYCKQGSPSGGQLLCPGEGWARASRPNWPISDIQIRDKVGQSQTLPHLQQLVGSRESTRDKIVCLFALESLLIPWSGCSVSLPRKQRE